MVCLNIPYFPPTTNKAYFSKGGRLHLSAEGRGFKAKVISHLTERYPKELRFFKKNNPYLIYLRLYMDDLENKGWPEKCQNRYKVFDATNRLKLVEDALKEVTGIDDSHHVAFLVEKRSCTPGASVHVEIRAWNLEEEVTPLDGFIRI